MSDIAIKVENLGKSYLVGHNTVQSKRYTTLRDVIADNAKNLARKTRDMLAGRAIVQGDEVEEFWALKNVNFEIKQGERVGIIGRNGAGKSTLLKILSRITEPTTGRISISGRVASLLEVGTGFHPELSGRENIFLNGAILGMSRREIQQKFSEIVEFAEVEKFIDTPVKRYSSGMYVRLAFSVAAHLEPDTLIVDEVLAVGDSEFQKKCIGKMNNISSDGRTIIFVSHNMLTLQKLCEKGIFLQAGSIIDSGKIDSIIDTYLSNSRSLNHKKTENLFAPHIIEVSILTREPRINKSIEIKINWSQPETTKKIKVGIGLNTIEGQRIFDVAPEDFGFITPCNPGIHEAIISIPANTLAARSYAISSGLWYENKSYHHIDHACTLTLTPTPTGRYAHQSKYDGLLTPKIDWIKLI